MDDGMYVPRTDSEVVLEQMRAVHHDRGGEVSEEMRALAEVVEKEKQESQKEF
eukprot:CAMPEP_0185767894 /NCGR_PEP_ID=MMETSP1174-20130828/45634_1 /TAXON_ID=35687 /ORGANISM="Dictyocha speculum, Strain CCMP1381" /LENGTH=52 /DNA_ID=CAMNT_0028452271 /DNA_START=14 /DNA_END=169 /DNA_ORIENTATION=-